MPTAILDNNPAKTGKIHQGVTVVPPQQLAETKPDYILVLSMAFDSIADQAAGLGFPRERMIAVNNDPVAALKKLGGTTYLSHYTHACDGQALHTSLRHYRLNGKMIRDNPSPVPTERQLEIVTTLSEHFRRAHNDAKQVPRIYQVGENWGSVIRRHKNSISSLALDHDVSGLAAMLANFFRNSLGASICSDAAAFKKFTEDPIPAVWLQHNLEVWAALLDGDGVLEEMAMPPIGNPFGYDVEGHVVNWNSIVNHARAYRCLRMLQDIERPVIGDIGGGFGGFAYSLLRRQSPLVYINFDIPENLIISSYYLSMAFPDKRFLFYDSYDMPMDRETLQQYDAVLLPNFMIPRMEGLSVNFFNNTISFSEMEYDTICEYFCQIDRVCNKYFYHENLSCHPVGYKGFPSSVFPRPRHFRLIFSSFSPWKGLDAYQRGHSYLERLYVRQPDGITLR